MNILYISYDGAGSNLGQSQIIPYILGLSKKSNDMEFFLLTFEKESTLQNSVLMNSIAKELKNHNIKWKSLRYHKTPSLIATMYDVIHGIIVGAWIIKNKKVKLIHGRTFIGSLIGFFLKLIFRVKVILDIRGFWPEERVEAGLWSKNGWLFRISKFIEKALIVNADEIVTLTLNAKKEIERFGYLRNKKVNINVIPTCADMENTLVNKINGSILNNWKFDNKFIISYIGSISTWYMSTEMFRFFDVAQRVIENSFFLILTQEDKLLENILRKTRDKMDNISILNVEHKFVPQYLSIAKIGLAFYKTGYSRKACCPVKFGEYLAQGLPVVINTGIGDCNEIILKEKVGVIINDFSSKEYERALKELMALFYEEDKLRQRCRAVAKKYLSLEMGVARCRDIYKRLSGHQIATSERRLFEADRN